MLIGNSLKSAFSKSDFVIRKYFNSVKNIFKLLFIKVIFHFCNETKISHIFYFIYKCPKSKDYKYTHHK